jgi:DNA-binding CsgD family transcriptional regulator/tetratricopeptide (TPR) repeat protein
MGDITVALPTFEQCVASLRAGGNDVDALDTTIVLADMWLTAGRPSQARALLEEALRTATAHGEPYPRATADLHTGLGELALERNDLTEAEDQLAAAATLAERACITENQHRRPTVMACLRAAQGEYARALNLLDEAADRYRPGFYPDLRPIPATRARIQLAGGDLDAAAEWAAQADVHLEDAAEFAREYELLTLVRLHLARHRTARAHGPGRDGEPGTAALTEVLDLLDRLASAAVASGRQGPVLEIRMLQALAQHASGDVPTAVSTLARAVDAAPEVDPYARLFLAEGPAMVALLEAAAAQPRRSTTSSTDALAALARRLLGRDDGAGVGAAAVAGRSGMEPASGVLPDPLSEREREVLRLLATELTGPQIARDLFISLNTFRTHTKRIFTKLDVTNRSAAVRLGRQLGLL